MVKRKLNESGFIPLLILILIVVIIVIYFVFKHAKR